MRPDRAASALAIALVLALGGCSTIEYYSQAVRGHLEMVQRSRPIDDVLADPKAPEAVREKLVRVRDMRTFAVRELGLPDNGSYRSYADLGRPFVVWNVFAAPALSIEPAKSCFPIAGCVSYRGFYGQEDAAAYADRMAAQGFDTYVGGVPAYSTLGWFDDPVLNTFIQYPDAEVARLLFHELAHQVVYVKDDSTFNESFATAVEMAGMQRWLAANAGAAERAAFDDHQARRKGFLALVMRYRDKLGDAYAQPVSDEAKRAAKARLFDEMRAEYEAMKAGWGGYAGYDRWFARGPNNANLASVATYTELTPAFLALLDREGGDMPRFYAAAKQLAGLPKPERTAALEGLVPMAVNRRTSPPG